MPLELNCGGRRGAKVIAMEPALTVPGSKEKSLAQIAYLETGYRFEVFRVGRD
ncbi:MAG: hypothetical protein QHH75_12830 [Bacillota bacterium]|nr:hypothetical protein [Bacillota bacterium]